MQLVPGANRVVRHLRSVYVPRSEQILLQAFRDMLRLYITYFSYFRLICITPH